MLLNGDKSKERELYLLNREIQKGNIDFFAGIDAIAKGDDEQQAELVRLYCAKWGTPPQMSGEAGYIYLMKAEGFFPLPFFGRYKIGLSNSPDRRLSELNGQQAPCRIRMLRSIQVPNMREAEASLHRQFKSNRRHGEWFDFSAWDLVLVNFSYDRLAKRSAIGKSSKPIAIAIALSVMAIGAIAITDNNAQQAAKPTTRQTRGK